MNKIMEKLDKKRLDWIISKTRRSENQTQFLFELCDCDFEKLKILETQIKHCFLNYCPGDKDEVEKILNMNPKIFLLYNNLSFEELNRLKLSENY